MRRLIFVVLFTALAVSLASAQWNKVSNEAVYRIHFADSLHGVAVGSAIVMVTSDGGTTWQIANVPGAWYLSVTAVNNRIWYASGGGVNNGVDPATIVKSTDGGATWQTQLIPQAHGIISMSFVDSLEGWGVGTTNVWSSHGKYGIIIHTTNGGLTWEIQRKNDLSHLYYVTFRDRNVGWASGDSSQVLRTTDGGKTWQTSFLSDTVMLGPISFLDDRNGWMLGVSMGGRGVAHVYRTTDGGATWQRIYKKYDYDFYRLQMVDSLYGVACGQDESSFGAVWETRDGGYTWNKVYQNGVYRGFYGISFLNRNLGWVSGLDGIVKYQYTPKNQPPISCQVAEPRDYTTVKLVYPTQPVKFSWGEATDPDGDTVRYTVRVIGPGLDTTASAGRDTFLLWDIMPRLKVGENYKWWVEASDGKLSTSSDTTWFKTSSTVTDVEDEPGVIPADFTLSQNYPNPFNPATTISYSLPKTEQVVLTVYSMLGQEVATLVNERKSPGTYQVTFNGVQFPSGVYLYRLTAGQFTQAKKMLLTK